MLTKNGTVCFDSTSSISFKLTVPFEFVLKKIFSISKFLTTSMTDACSVSREYIVLILFFLINPLMAKLLDSVAPLVKIRS